MWAFGGEPTFEVDERASVITTGELVQNRQGKILHFVGLDSKGEVVLAKDESELKRAHRSLKQERLRFQSVSRLTSASWVPGQIVQEGWEHGGSERQEPEDGDGSQVPPARDDDGNEVDDEGDVIDKAATDKEAVMRAAMLRWVAKRTK
jgi:hypothetical protein